MLLEYYTAANILRYIMSALAVCLGLPRLPCSFVNSLPWYILEASSRHLALLTLSRGRTIFLNYSDRPEYGRAESPNRLNSPDMVRSSNMAPFLIKCSQPLRRMTCSI